MLTIKALKGGVLQHEKIYGRDVARRRRVNQLIRMRQGGMLHGGSGGSSGSSGSTSELVIPAIEVPNFPR